MEKYFVGLYEKEIDHQIGISHYINYITADEQNEEFYPCKGEI